MSNKWDELVFGVNFDGDRYKCKCEPVKKKHDHCGCNKRHDHCGCEKKDECKREKECTVKFYVDCD